MRIPADVHADVMSVLPTDLGEVVMSASRRPSAGRSSWPTSSVLIDAWPDITPARAWLSAEATRISLGRLLLEWRLGQAVTVLAPYQDAAARIDQAVRDHLLSTAGEVQLRVLEGIEVLKAAALAQPIPNEGSDSPRDPTMSKRSRGWLASAKGFVNELHDLRNAVVYTALVLHLEFAQASALPEFTDGDPEIAARQQLLVFAAAGGCHVAARGHVWMRRAFQDNVAVA